jgi:predicted  nucleic acid-binding Zn-ribbon protein
VTVYEQLLEVQALDLSLQQLTHRRANLAERAALEVNASQRSGVEAQRGEVDVTHRELVRRQHLLEDEINGVRGRAETHEATLYSGSVNNPRELPALPEDIESLRRRQRVLEDEDLEIMEELEPVVAQLAEPDGSAAEVAASYTRADRLHAIACRIEQIGTTTGPRWRVVALHMG